MKSVFRKGAGFFILSRKYGVYKKISSLPGRYRKEDTNTKTKLDLTKLFLLEVSQLHLQIYRKYLKKQKYLK